MDIFFCTEQKYSRFTNFSHTPFKLDGRHWPSVEHYYQAMKTTSEDEQESIRKCALARDAKALGLKTTLREDWDNIKYNVVLKALRMKFSCDPLKSLLLETGDAMIYEDSPNSTWGTGVRGGIGPGQNLLGKAIMQVRDELVKAIPKALF